MTIGLDVVLASAAGLVAGLIIGWMWGNSRRGQRVALEVAEAEARLGPSLTTANEERVRLDATLRAERQASALAARQQETRLSDLQRRMSDVEAEAKLVGAELASVREREASQATELTKARESFEEKLAVYQDAEHRLTQTFEALSARTLDANTRRFLDLAAAKFESLKGEASHDLEQRQQHISAVLDPMKHALDKVERTLSTVEAARQEERGRLSTHLTAMAGAQKALEDETRRLVMALRAPQVRGRWGEIQLRRVVELAGMDEHCDFTLQQSVATEDGHLRPDMVVTVPGGRTIVVDAKAPVMAYLEAVNATDEAAREARLVEHAAQVRTHVTKLSGKSYWEHQARTPDFVVMFLPGESFFSAALQHDPTLIEYGADRRVFLAGPLTLLALLRTVAYGWSQERLAEHAREISVLGKDLYERICTMTDHLADLRKKLEGAVQAHNRAIGSLESKVLFAARRFRDLGVPSTKVVEQIEPIDLEPRRLQAGELRTGPDVDAEPVEAETVAPPGDPL